MTLTFYLKLKDTVVPAVRDEEAAARSSQHPAGKSERAVGLRRQTERPRPAPPRAGRRARPVELCDHAFDHRRELPGEELAGHGPDDTAGRIQQDHRRPGVDAVSAPDT